LQATIAAARDHRRPERDAPLDEGGQPSRGSAPGATPARVDPPPCAPGSARPTPPGAQATFPGTEGQIRGPRPGRASFRTDVNGDPAVAKVESKRIGFPIAENPVASWCAPNPTAGDPVDPSALRAQNQNAPDAIAG